MNERTKSDASQIISAILEAQNTLAEYNNYVLRAAASGDNPDTNPRVRALKTELHTATMMAHMRIRHYVKERLANTYWRVSVPTVSQGGEERIDTGAPEYELWMRSLRKGAEAGLFVLDELQAPTSKQTTIEESRHQGTTETTTYRAELMGQGFYEDAVNVLGETMVSLGLGADVEGDQRDARIYETDLANLPPDEDGSIGAEAAGD